MSAERLATIAAGLRPADLTSEEGIGYDMATALLGGGVQAPPIWERAHAVFGGEGTRENCRSAFCSSRHFTAILEIGHELLKGSVRLWRKAAVRGIGAFARPRRKPNHDSRTVHFGCKKRPS
jgi:hypothetical protein